MRIDISSESFDLSHAYTRVLLQQGRPLLDRDWNEQTSILFDHFRATLRAIYGHHGGPSHGECGFIPTATKDGLLLSKGLYSIDGIVLHCEENRIYSGGQERFKPEKAYFIYLEAIEREVTAAQQAGLLDSALPGVDVAARGQMTWRISHEDWSTESAELRNCDMIKKANLWFRKKYEQQAPPDVSFPKVLAEELHKIVKKNSNQVLRVEYHEGGVWKFSGDNAFALFKIAGFEENPMIADSDGVLDLGVLAAWAPAKGDIVELLTEEDLRFNQPGSLQYVIDTVSPQPDHFDSIDRLEIKLSPPSKPGLAARFARVWKSMIEAEADVVPGVLTGDYWQITNREGTLDLKRAKLKRPTHVYAPIALITTDPSAAPLQQMQRFQRIVAPQWREVDEKLDLLAV